MSLLLILTGFRTLFYCFHTWVSNKLILARYYGLSLYISFRNFFIHTFSRQFWNVFVSKVYSYRSNTMKDFFIAGARYEWFRLFNTLLFTNNLSPYVNYGSSHSCILLTSYLCEHKQIISVTSYSYYFSNFSL